MKRLSVFLLSIVIVLVMFFVACENKQNTGFSPSQKPAETAQSSLTNEKIERAIDKLFGSDKISGSVKVLGVQEIPAQNAARADIRFDNLNYTSRGAGITFHQPIYSGSGSATLSRYNDGRWVLNTVSIRPLETYTGSIPIE